MTMEANSSPKPKWDANAAIPKPAAIPATGPIHEREGVAAPAPAAGVAAAAGAAAVGAFSGAAWRWVPMDLPPPMRFAASASIDTEERPTAKTRVNSESMRFM